MSLLQNSNAISAGGYDVNNSLRFRSSASAYLNRTPASTTNRRTVTYSAWVKRGKLDSTTTLYTLISANAASSDYIGFYSDGLRLSFFGGTYPIQTTQVFRDPSAWYHIVVAIDTTQATSSNRVKLYINGNQVTAFSTATYPPQNYDTSFNLNTVAGLMGQVGSTGYFDGYMAEVNWVDGQALTPSSFGETDTTTGVWKPKAYTGTYGTNGFYLKFSDIATTSGSNAGLGKDFSGNSNYWTTNNISVTSGTTYDAMTDSPTNTSATVANYCVLNPVAYYGGYNVLSQGNLQFTSGNTNWMRAVATFAVSSGKWYWEITANNSLSQMHGILTATTTTYYSGATNWVGYDATGYAYFSDNGQKWNNNAGATYGSTFGAGDIIGVAFDADNGTLTFYKNNVSQGTAFTGLTSGPYVPAVSVATTSGANTCSANFGQRPFSYTPPTGYLALNTFNLPNSTIVKGSTVMDATLYTGNGTSQSITNASAFKPDLVWVKGRSGATDHALYDAVRGTTKDLVSNSTAAETTQSTGLTSFNSDGFTLGALSKVNTNGATYVAWCWKANGAGVTNTSGSITSTVSVNTTAGFSVVTYTGNGGTGATVGHGLGVAPKMVIVKQRSSTEAWVVGHQNLTGWNYILNLNSTAAQFIPSTQCLGTPTSTNIVVGPNASTNSNTATYVAYCWAEIAGFSKFGSYTGNASTDGPFVYLGFIPKFIMVKSSSGIGNWFMMDSMRDTSNVATRRLFANLSNAEDTSGLVDFTSNGFKLRMSTALNDAATYIYMAFAESPFRNSLAR